MCQHLCSHAPCFTQTGRLVRACAFVEVVGTVGVAQGKAKAQALPCSLSNVQKAREKWEQRGSWQAVMGRGEEVAT